MIAVPHFEREFGRFSDSIYRRFNDGPFVSFRSGAAKGWEGYKPLLRSRALARLDAAFWSEAEIGSGSILEHAIEAIEISGGDQTRNNLVSWEGKYGPGTASHTALLTARTNPTRRQTAERWLWDAYRGNAADDEIFERLRKIAGDGYRENEIGRVIDFAQTRHFGVCLDQRRVGQDGKATGPVDHR